MISTHLFLLARSQLGMPYLYKTHVLIPVWSGKSTRCRKYSVSYNRRVRSWLWHSTAYTGSLMGQLKNFYFYFGTNKNPPSQSREEQWDIWCPHSPLVLPSRPIWIGNAKNVLRTAVLIAWVFSTLHTC